MKTMSNSEPHPTTPGSYLVRSLLSTPARLLGFGRTPAANTRNARGGRTGDDSCAAAASLLCGQPTHISEAHKTWHCSFADEDEQQQQQEPGNQAVKEAARSQEVRLLGFAWLIVGVLI